MGFWSSLANIGGLVAAPFTGGASLAISGLVGSGLDLLGGAQSSSAAKDAAAVQAQSAQQSNQLLGQGLANAETRIGQGQEQAYGNLNPYLGVGAAGASNLTDLLNPGSSLYSGFQGQANLPTFQPPNPQDVLNNPAIQFQLQQGLKAVNASQSAKGMANSGQTLKALNDYAQGVASQGYNNLFNQSAQTWQNQFTGAQQNFANQFGVYQNMIGNRLGATNSALNAGLSPTQLAAQQSFGAGTDVAGQILGVAGQQGQNLMGGANAQAAGKVGSANAWNNALGGIGGNAVSLAALNGFNQPNNLGSYNPTPSVGVPTMTVPPGGFPQSGTWGPYQGDIPLSVYGLGTGGFGA